MVLKHDLKGLVLLKFYILSNICVLYVPNCPFNLLSASRLTRFLDCNVTFTNNNVILRDQSSGQTIGIECESQRLYYLSVSSQTCSIKDSSLTIHAQLGYPNLSKLHKLVSNLSKISNLHCESCQLGKYIWSNQLDLLLKASHRIWCVGYTSLFMVLSNLRELGSTNSAL